MWHRGGRRAAKSGISFGRRWTHLFGGEKSYPEIAPVSAIQIARNDTEADVLLNDVPDQGVERLTGRCHYPLGGTAFLTGEALDRTVEMNVRGMDEAE